MNDDLFISLATNHIYCLLNFKSGVTCIELN